MKNMFKSFISGLSGKEKKMLYVAAVFVFLALFDRLIIGPVLVESNSVEGKIEYQVKLIKKNLLILQYKERIIGEDNAYSIFYTKQGLTQDKLNSEFFGEVEAVAQKVNNITLSYPSPISMVEEKKFVLFSQPIEFEAPMEDVVKFIYEINSLKKPLRVGPFEIIPTKAQENRVKFLATIYKIIIIPEGVFKSSYVKTDLYVDEKKGTGGEEVEQE